MALNPVEEQAAADRAELVRQRVGHPTERWEALTSQIQDAGIREFADVADAFLALMWCLDAYRQAEAPPHGMGRPGARWQQRLEGAYRGKGNWFATLLALLLDNRTGQRIRSRGSIQGYSQDHQIDLAWPDRKVDPIVCAESKVTGAPPFGDTRARGAMDDWTNRRKELKFAATDLKLSRREQTASIGHWDVWRTHALPKCYMLWAARLSPDDSVEKMVREAAALVDSYLDGAGVVAWRTNAAEDGYELVTLPRNARVVALDDVLWRIEDEIKRASQ